MIEIVFFLFAYLLGSVPFGLLLCKYGGYGDIREIGSGNIGATNVLRTGNKWLALATFLLDTLKGAAAVLIAFCYKEADWFIWGAGLCAILGHMYPVWLKFKGGKGVATTIGTLFALSWPVGVCACAIWLGLAVGFQISSVAALGAFIALPALAQVFDGFDALPFAAAMTALVFWRHRGNMERLLTGTEPKMSFKKHNDVVES